MDESLKVRFWEVDFLRGLATIQMVLFHSIYDLDYFGVYDVDFSGGVWFYLARFTAALFLLLVGVSLFLSYSRARLLGEEDRFRFRLLKRSIWILSLAMGITLVTYFSIGKGFIIFGVLHLIGISLLLAYPFLRLQWQNFVFGLFFIAAGLYLQKVNVEFPWLIWLGLAPQDFSSLDYVPIFPWFGVVLMGMGLGDLLYRNYRRRANLPDLTYSVLVRPLTFLGKNSLAIYLIHQPVLIALLYLAGVTFPWR
jgi:uncharacterized membrane protein